ncbi:unnamed protein product [Calicophoron daubneyi]|uniref:Uncharacterized protein n=1 Tax=Calicophoron daubneyi TaxID=300641 RepID=A0AAV2TUQ2_CALDB
MLSEIRKQFPESVETVTVLKKRVFKFWLRRGRFGSVAMKSIRDPVCEKLDNFTKIPETGRNQRCKAKLLSGSKYNLQYSVTGNGKHPSMKELEMCFRMSLRYGPPYITSFNDANGEGTEEDIGSSMVAVLVETRSSTEKEVLEGNCDRIKKVMRRCFSPFSTAWPCVELPSGNDVIELSYNISASVYNKYVKPETGKVVDSILAAFLDDLLPGALRTVEKSEKRVFQFWIDEALLSPLPDAALDYANSICDEFDRVLKIPANLTDERCTTRKLRGITYDISYPRAYDIAYPEPKKLERCVRMGLHYSGLYIGSFKVVRSNAVENVNEHRWEEISIELRSPRSSNASVGNCDLIKSGLKICAPNIHTFKACQSVSNDDEIIELTYDLRRKPYDGYFEGKDEVEMADNMLSEIRKQFPESVETVTVLKKRVFKFWLRRGRFGSVAMKSIRDPVCEKLDNFTKIPETGRNQRCKAKLLSGSKYNLQYSVTGNGKHPSMKELEMCFRMSLRYGPPYITSFNDANGEGTEENIGSSMVAVLVETRSPTEKEVLEGNCDRIKKVMRRCFSPFSTAWPCVELPSGNDVIELSYNISASVYNKYVKPETGKVVDSILAAFLDDLLPGALRTVEKSEKRVFQFWIDEALLSPLPDAALDYANSICDEFDRVLKIPANLTDERCTTRKLRGITYDISYPRAYDIAYPEPKKLERCVRMGLHYSGLYIGSFKDPEFFPTSSSSAQLRKLTTSANMDSPETDD